MSIVNANVELVMCVRLRVIVHLRLYHVWLWKRENLSLLLAKIEMHVDQEDVAIIRPVVVVVAAEVVPNDCPPLSCLFSEYVSRLLLQVRQGKVSQQCPKRPLPCFHHSKIDPCQACPCQPHRLPGALWRVAFQPGHSDPEVGGSD